MIFKDNFIFCLFVRQNEKEEGNSDDENYNSEENLNILDWKIFHLVVLDDDVVGTLSLLKLPGPRNADRGQG